MKITFHRLGRYPSGNCRNRCHSKCKGSARLKVIGKVPCTCACHKMVFITAQLEFVNDYNNKPLAKQFAKTVQNNA